MLISKIKKHIIVILIICFFVYLLNALDIGCPFLFCFGIPCPTCGVTRALRSLLKLDFTTYAIYQPMALPLVSAVMLMLHARVIKSDLKKCIYAFTFCVLLINLIYYFFRLIRGDFEILDSALTYYCKIVK